MPFGLLAFITVLSLLVVVAGVVPKRWRLAAWTVVVIVGVVPWGSWVGHEHWSRVEWIPFTQIVRPRDLGLNFFLYCPLGFFMITPTATPVSSRQMLVAVVYALVLSACTEFTQIYSHGRFPAMTDVTMNVAGAVAGVLIARAVGRPDLKR